ncbi:hypothetical protein [Marinibacterium profundimaris]|uniref:hypothetical protein n=1 Tax=Marinibacterium profundimaris TaxID=1679460 RepID=UPI001302FE66|nr:hypothetical protein [Marinibacterium profundimaris]
MKLRKQTRAPPVLGISAARPRPTMAGAFWLALAIALPAGALLCGVEVIWRVAMR